MFLLLAIACLGVGLFIYFRNARKPEEFSAMTAHISMLLIALFPVILLFSFDPDSSATGEFSGFTLGGAIGAFFIIWLFGTNRALRAEKIDSLASEVVSLREKLGQAYVLSGGEDKAVKPKVLQETKYIKYRVKPGQKKIVGIVTGNLIHVKGIDVWVNSENTNMQMSRFFDLSISGTIRYHGAKKDEFDEVSEDTIADELEEKMKGRGYVRPGVVLVTTPGELGRTHAVKKIFHCATVNGQVGAGYQAIENVEMCIFNCLKRMDAENENEPLKSILFPLIGTGKGKADPASSISSLIIPAVEYLKNTPETKIEQVYFLAFTDKDLVYCQQVIETRLDYLEKAI